jgi:hypothetical protein
MLVGVKVGRHVGVGGVDIISILEIDKIVSKVGGWVGWWEGM